MKMKENMRLSGVLLLFCLHVHIILFHCSQPHTTDRRYTIFVSFSLLPSPTLNKAKKFILLKFIHKTLKFTNLFRYYKEFHVEYFIQSLSPFFFYLLELKSEPLIKNMPMYAESKKIDVNSSYQNTEKFCFSPIFFYCCKTSRLVQI